MVTVLQKNQLRDGYYYLGFISQNYTVMDKEQLMIVGLWDSKLKCFWFWEYENNKKMKHKLLYLSDIDNEIEHGFFPVKEIIPKDEQIIE